MPEEGFGVSKHNPIPRSKPSTGCLGFLVFSSDHSQHQRHAVSPSSASLEANPATGRWMRQSLRQSQSRQGPARPRPLPSTAGQPFPSPTPWGASSRAGLCAPFAVWALQNQVGSVPAPSQEAPPGPSPGPCSVCRCLAFSRPRPTSFQLS